MGMLDWLGAGKKKGLTLDAVRREEIRLGIRESQSLSKLEQTEREREAIFNQGAKSPSPLKRRQLARMYDLKSRGIKMVERELAMVSKELATVAAVKLALERQQMAKDGLSRLLERVDEAELRTMLEDDAVSQEVYLERLGEILGTVTDEAPDIVRNVGQEGAEVLQVWQKMDEGEIENLEDGLKAAREMVKEKGAAGKGELEATEA